MGRANMNDDEREQWIMNDEGLYNWWRGSRLSARAFIRENRDELTRLIEAATNKPPRPRQWWEVRA